MVFRVGVRRTRFVSVPLCLHLSRLELIEAALAAPPAVTHLPRAPSFRYHSPTAFEQARGGALGAGGGRVGFAGGGLF